MVFFVEWRQESAAANTSQVTLTPAANEKMVYPARDGGSNFTNAQGMGLRSSPNNVPAS